MYLEYTSALKRRITRINFFPQNYQCHSKVTADFVFLGACSLVATAGHGSEGRNVALWDTLLPQNKSLIQGMFHSPRVTSRHMYLS